MPREKSAQLVLDFAPAPRGVSLTRPLARHRYRKTLLQKIHYVRRFFPELDGRTIRVGLTRSAAGLAVPGGLEVWVHPSQTTYHTIAHEFVHLLQGRGDIPKGEKSCDVFALARHWTLNDSMPFYVRVPSAFLTPEGTIGPGSAKILCDTARLALAKRKEGLRNYIAYFEETIESFRRERKTREEASPGRARRTGRAAVFETGKHAKTRHAEASPLQVDVLLSTPDGDPLD